MSESPLQSFTEKLAAFAGGQAGIRNPFAIVAVDPAYEHTVTQRLAAWTETPPAELTEVSATIQPVWLDELISETTVYNLAVGLSEEQNTATIRSTLESRLAEELVDEIRATSDLEALRDPSHVLLLLNVGSVYPFTRASELLDELDRRNVSSTIGVAFPGVITNGKLAAYGVDARGYYPAHLIEGQITAADLQQ
jgi:hypothetical protein